jgi:hypothetical protein
MNEEIRTEAAQFPGREYINIIFIVVYGICENCFVYLLLSLSIFRLFVHVILTMFHCLVAIHKSA